MSPITVKPTGLLLAGAALALLPLTACGSRDSGTPAITVEESHRRMVERLAEIRDRTADENGYLGDVMARELRRGLDDLPSSAPVRERIELQRRLGPEELRLGNTERAIEILEAALGEAPSLPAELRSEYGAYLSYQLGLAYMRLAENQNCVARHTSESCLMPIRGSGVHADKRAARDAIGHLTRVIELLPRNTANNLAARWLLNIAYMTVGEYPGGVPDAYLVPPEVFTSRSEFRRFEDVAPRLGLNTFDLSGGAIADDFDGDGLLDIVTSTFDTAGSMHYFRNNGDGSFTERSRAAGLHEILGGLNLLQADADNDGDLDILVLRGAWLAEGGHHPNSLLLNDGRGTFRDATFAVGLGEGQFPTQTAGWADYDLDGDLDLYVGNESRPERPIAGQLFRNDGGRFTDVAEEAGVENLRYAKGVSWGDYDDDGDPDLYVSNLGGENRLYRNEGDGRFVDVAPGLEVTRPLDSFPVWFWDFDNDGALDLYVSSYYAANAVRRLYAVAASYLGRRTEAEPPCLYRGDGRGGFTEVAGRYGVDLVTMPMGANFGDLDHDGYPDFYLGTGYPNYDGLMPNVMFHNRGGRGFDDVTFSGGFGHLQKGHGVVFADLDDDGDQDVFEQMGGAWPGDRFGNVLYENPGFGNHWLAVRLVGVNANRYGVGARVRLVVRDADGSSRTVYHHVNSGGSFGANPLTRQIGLGACRAIESLEIRWPTPGGPTVQLLEDLPLDGRVRITEGVEEYGFEQPPAQRFAR